MGASTTAQLISRGKAENSYNNSGIKSDSQWIDFFTDALRDLVDDLNLEKVTTIAFVVGTREYDMPTDYHAFVLLTEPTGYPLSKRRNYNSDYPSGYWMFNRGSGYVIDLYSFTSAQNFTLTYQAYAEDLVEANKATQKPQIPSVGEKALIYYAICKGLRNNSQPEAAEYERLYEAERKKIRNAVARGAG